MSSRKFEKNSDAKKTDAESSGASASVSSATSATSSKFSINRRRQEGNPVLKYIRSVPFEWADIKADFEAGKELGILYLTLKWHKLHPGYIETRMNSDGSTYPIKVLLVVVNVDPCFMLRELNLFCYRTGWTLLLCYSVEEAAEYLENLFLSRTKNEKSAIDAIQERRKKKGDCPETHKEMRSAIELLTSIRAVTQSDGERLIATFGSLRAIANADVEKLLLCPGLGSTKAENIHSFFRTPFLKS